MESLYAQVDKLILCQSKTMELSSDQVKKGQSLIVELTEFFMNNTDKCIGTQFKTFLNENTIGTVDGHQDMVLLGIIAFNLFVQENWTGPTIDVEAVGSISNLMLSAELNKKAVDYLEVDGDEVYQLIKYPILLLIAYVVLVESTATFNLVSTLPIWSVKCLNVFCHVIDEVKESHLARFQSLFDRVEETGDGFKQQVSKEVMAEYYMTCFHLYLKCYNYPKAEQCLQQVKKLLNLEISLTAALGKRTKFQSNDLAQMQLAVKSTKEETANEENSENTNAVSDLPTDVELDNDTLLPHIKFVDGDNTKSTKLSPMEQACIVCCCVFIQKTSPKDLLIQEEMAPYVEAVLTSPQSYAVQLKALLLRCVVEMSKSRKVERALMQLETIVKSFAKPSPPFPERHLYAQAIDLNPQWTNEQTHAQLCFAIGYVDTALEIFLRLQLWDDVISCYQRLGRHGKAEEVIRDQLKIRESATLWCLLGDVTLEKEYYEKAWEFSKYRSARAQRSLGQLHLRKQEFKEAIPYFQKSLDLNCLQPGIAFSLGCSYMAINDVAGGAKALQLCVSLEPENPTAWSNLATNYIRLNQVEKAYKALKEATRLSYDNWKIWENFFLVATDLGKFEDTMTICHRLIDLKRKTLDVEVLQILTRAVIEDIPNSNGVGASYLKPKLLKMFGHVTSLITSDADVWELYADVCLSEKTEERREKGLQYLYKSFRCYNQSTAWENNEKKVKHVMRVANKTTDVTQDICSKDKGKMVLVTTTKMNLSNLVTCLRKAFCDNDGNTLPSVVPHVEELQQRIAEMQTLLDGDVS